MNISYVRYQFSINCISLGIPIIGSKTSPSRLTVIKFGYIIQQKNPPKAVWLFTLSALGESYHSTGRFLLSMSRFLQGCL